MIVPWWLWLYFFIRRCLTLFVAVLKPTLEREFMQYTTDKQTLNSLGGKFFDGTYLQAVQHVTRRSKSKLHVCFIQSTSRWTDDEAHSFDADEHSIYLVVCIDDYYGFLLSRKLLVHSIPTTLVISLNTAGSPVVERRIIGSIPFFVADKQPVLKRMASPRIVIQAESSKSLVAEQDEAYQRSIQQDSLRQRRVEFERQLPSLLQMHLSDEKDAYKVALYFPNGARVVKSVKAEAPLAILVAIARETLPSNSFMIKSTDPPLSLSSKFDASKSALYKQNLRESGISTAQKFIVEIE
jgi:hypothetical protein